MTNKVKSADLIYLKTYIPTEVGEYSSYFINYLLEGSFTFRIAEAQNVSESHPEIGREIFFKGHTRQLYASTAQRSKCTKFRVKYKWCVVFQHKPRGLFL